MKLKIIIFFSLFFNMGSFYSQNTKLNFVYDLNIKDKDTLNERFILSIRDKKSYFYNETQKKLDSLKDYYVERNDEMGYMADKGNYSKQKIKYYVFKEVDKYTYQIKILFNTIQYSENRPNYKWNILNEYENILGKKCQKAETILGEVKYFAWFTNEIPINNGPYLFQGLPGLITKVIRADKKYEIILKGINSKNTITPQLKTKKVIKIVKDNLQESILGSYMEFFSITKATNKNQEIMLKKKIIENSNKEYLYAF